MKMSELVNALAYELGLWLISRNPDLAFNPWVQRMLKYCRPDWSSWRAKHVMKSVSGQSKKIIEEWAEDNRKARCNKLAKKARDKFRTPLCQWKTLSSNGGYEEHDDLPGRPHANHLAD